MQQHITLGLGCLLWLCSIGMAQPRPDISANRPPSPDQRIKTFKVASIEELVQAIGPNRRIEISPGEYVLSDLKDRHMDFVRWDPNFDGDTLTIRKVNNLTIVGLGSEPVRLVVRPSYVFVLNFDNCHNIELLNLTMGHAPEKGYCTNGVVGAADCSDLRIRKCDLFGSGTEGLTLKNVSGLTFEDSTIRDCSYGIMTIEGSEKLAFVRSRFMNNQEFWGVNIRDSKDLKFTECVFEGNQAEDSLFQVVSCSNITVDGSTFSNNTAKSLTNNSEVVKIRK
jgi:polygalacturonase